jgi:hypothetical protein
MAKQELWGEEEHGLGINRKVPREQVEAFEEAILTATQMAESLGVKPENFLALCETAVDIAWFDEQCEPGSVASGDPFWIEQQVKGGERLGWFSQGGGEKMPTPESEKICGGCGELIDPEEVRILIPEGCDVSACGHLHRDCGIAEEVGEDGLQFEENVTRLFAIFASVLKDWCDADMVKEQMLPQINEAVAKLNREVTMFWGSG